MTQQKVNYDDLKKSGYILQRDAEHFTVRIRVPGGALTSEQITAIGKIADEWGRGELHLTTRQGVQIPWVRFEDLGEVTRALDGLGTPPGSCGPRVRNITSCVGLPRCPQALVNSQELAKKIDGRFFDLELPTKIKIAISGCPNACSKPQINDIGIMGAVKPQIIPEKCDACGICARKCKESAISIVDDHAEIDFTKCVYCGECIGACPKNAAVAEHRGYTVFVGGNIGRHPRLAYKILDMADEEAVFRVIENIVELVKEKGERKERLGHLIERLGLGESLGRLARH